MDSTTRFALALWISVCCLMIFAMVVLGGAVRLTGSGLSMVEWKPLIGIIPPLNEADWLVVFDKYKQFPEYKAVNQSMTLVGFKFIYLMEYAHRVLGRLIGIVFLLPYLYFVFSGKIDKTLIRKFCLVFILGAIQGLIGWYMVKSGLVDDPHVSQYRLTLHFMVAVFIYAYLARLLFSLYINRTEVNRPGLYLGYITLAVLFIMLTTGGLVAGTRAGYVFNTWPLMNGEWLPAHLFSLSPSWTNFLENLITIQFTHRWLAVVVLALVIIFSLYTIMKYDHRLARLAGSLAIAAILVQFGLGLATLLLRVPVDVGVMHQGGALLLLTAILFSLSLYLPASSQYSNC